MTFVLVIQAALGFALDWSGNHLLNPLWHPHARFHAVHDDDLVPRCSSRDELDVRARNVQRLREEIEESVIRPAALGSCCNTKLPGVSVASHHRGARRSRAHAKA